MTVTPLNQGRLIVESSAGRREELLLPSNNFNDPLIDDFVAAIQQDREPLISGPAGCGTNQVIEAAYLQKTVQSQN